MSENALDAFNRRMREKYNITEEDTKREIERQRHYAAHNRASALAHAAEVDGHAAIAALETYREGIADAKEFDALRICYTAHLLEIIEGGVHSFGLKP